MRSLQIRRLGATAVLAFILVTTPVSASAPGTDDDRGRGLAILVKIVKRVTKFVLHPLDELTLPKP